MLDTYEKGSKQAEAECEAIAVECVVEPLAKEVIIEALMVGGDYTTLKDLESRS